MRPPSSDEYVALAFFCAACLAICWYGYKWAMREGCLVNRVILMVIGAAAGALGILIWRTWL